MRDTIQHISIRTNENDGSLQGQGKRLYSEHGPETLCLSGENSSTPAVKKVSTALSSVTKAITSPQTLSDRLTLSLISAGLVRGITHLSIRNLCVAPEQVTVLNVPVGEGQGAPRVDCLCWRWTVESGLPLEYLEI
jgi:hypothetical protein